MDINANSSFDSSHINACVAPVPLFIIIPASKIGNPDCVDDSNIKGSFTVRFCVLIIDVVPFIVKLPLAYISPVILRSPLISNLADGFLVPIPKSPLI